MLQALSPRRSRWRYRSPQRAAPAVAAAEARHLIDVLGQHGGYIFGPGHTYIQPDAPIENIMAMYDTAISYSPWE